MRKRRGSGRRQPENKLLKRAIAETIAHTEQQRMFYERFPHKEWKRHLDILELVLTEPRVNWVEIAPSISYMQEFIDAREKLREKHKALVELRKNAGIQDSASEVGRDHQKADFQMATLKLLLVKVESKRSAAHN